MLIRFDNDNNKHGAIKNSRELYDVTIELMSDIDGQKTTVLGPIIADHPDDLQHNIDVLHNKAKRLAVDWVVLDLSSFRDVISFLLRKEKVTAEEYPHVILENFLLPLLKSQIFKTIFMQKDFEKSFSANVAHDIALANDIFIVYFE